MRTVDLRIQILSRGLAGHKQTVASPGRLSLTCSAVEHTLEFASDVTRQHGGGANEGANVISLDQLNQAAENSEKGVTLVD